MSAKRPGPIQAIVMHPNPQYLVQPRMFFDADGTLRTIDEGTKSPKARTAKRGKKK